MNLGKRIIAKPFVQRTIGVGAAEYLRFVWNTSRFTVEPADIYQQVRPNLPVIIAMWHGQHFMAPFIKHDEHRVRVLISRHRDGAVNAIAAERLGVETIRGSGNHGGRFDRKGGVEAFRTMLTSLQAGYNIALTADVPKVSRVAGLGIIMLARESGRPIYPMAIATSRRIELKNWDRSAVNLPFSKGALIGGDVIRVAHDADSQSMEAARLALEETLNSATERAYRIADRRRVDG